MVLGQSLSSLILELAPQPMIWTGAPGPGGSAIPTTPNVPWTPAASPSGTPAPSSTDLPPAPGEAAVTAPDDAADAAAG